MRAFVYTDKALARYAGRFVWLSIDTEDAANAPFLTKYPIKALPTMMVVDPRRDEVVFRYVGGASVPQLEKMLDDAERTASHRSRLSADTLLTSADKAAAAGKNEEAARLYQRAIDQSPRNWKRLGRAAESLIVAYALAGNDEQCATAAHALHPKLSGSSAANVASTGLGCAVELDERNSDRGTIIRALERATRAALANAKLPLSGDDRSGLYISLIGARSHAKDEAGARKLTEEWAAFLEGEAAKAQTPEQRTVFDSHRVSAYLQLGTPEKAIPMLEQSARDFPDDYNPYSRMALAYKAMREYDRALTMSERALSRAYGPRKIGIYRTRADIFAEQGDKAAARRTIEEAIEFAKSLPRGQRSDRTIAALEKKLTDY